MSHRDPLFPRESRSVLSGGMTSDDEALDALKEHLARGLEEMKAVRDFALGFHTGNHRMKRGERAALLKTPAAVRKETGCYACVRRVRIEA
jgi:hypothetical protein